MLLDVATLGHPEVLLQLQREPTIYSEGLASDERGFVGAQERDRVRNVEWRTNTAHGVLRFEEAQPIRVSFPLGPTALGHDVARTHRIDADPVWAILGRH